MSVSFIVDAAVSRRSVLEPCLCAQMAPVFGALLRGEGGDWDALRPHADSQCGRCGGTGVELVERDMRPQANFANDNAHIVARALGIDIADGSGSMDIATLRRGLLRARNVSVSAELRPGAASGRLIARAYTRGDLDAALTRLQELVDAAYRLGATRILWE